jgi:beta-phosphoglucomutase-like phosphatase (HAD superfamily)
MADVPYRPIEKLPCEVFMELAKREVKELRKQVYDMKQEAAERDALLAEGSKRLEEAHKHIGSLQNRLEACKQEVRRNPLYVQLLNDHKALQKRYRASQDTNAELINRMHSTKNKQP